MAAGKDAYGREFVDDAAEHIREYLDYHGYPVLKQDRYKGDVRTWHICPCCGSGSGNNGKYTPAFNVYRGKYGDLRWGCFACPEGQKGGSIFDLAEHIEGAHTWGEKKEAIARFLGVDVGGGMTLRAGKGERSAHRALQPGKAQGEPAESREDVRKRHRRNAAYVKDCMGHVHETDFFYERGLADETIERFYLGYDPKEHAAVIPYLDVRYRAVETYAKRNVQVGANERGDTWKHKNAPGCKKIIFNMAALACTERRPVFVTEAPMDAMSIVQAGGAAIALGGTYNGNLFEVIDGFTNHVCDPKDIVFVLALDSDGPGDAGAELLAEGFQKRGIAFTKAEHPCFTSYHDPNEALMNDPALLKEAVRYEIDRACRIEARVRAGEGHLINSPKELSGSYAASWLGDRQMLMWGQLGEKSLPFDERDDLRRSASTPCLDSEIEQGLESARHGVCHERSSSKEAAQLVVE